MNPTMRVRPLKRTQEPTTPRRTARRPHVAPAPAPAAEAPAAESTPDRDLSAERRWKAAGGPEDVAWYRCGCGFQFEADVSTSVDCPHCGGAQAW